MRREEEKELIKKWWGEWESKDYSYKPRGGWRGNGQPRTKRTHGKGRKSKSFNCLSLLEPKQQD